LIKQEIYRELPSLPRLIIGEVEEGLTVDEVEVGDSLHWVCLIGMPECFREGYVMFPLF
jgi:hypothetical protein